MQTTDDQLTRWLDAARALGEDAGRNAASWCVDGNSDRAERARVLAMMREGDPQAFDFLPPMPNLSGEWADDPTPGSLVEDVTGLSRWNVDDATTDEIVFAWDAGANIAFGAECERLLVQFCED